MYDGILIYPFLTVALYHLLARAMITKFLWSRFPDWLSTVTQCPSCSGFWYGVMVASLGLSLDVSFLGSQAWWTIIVVGLAALVWTPIGAALHEFAIRSAINGSRPLYVVVDDGHDLVDDDKPAMS